MYKDTWHLKWAGLLGHTGYKVKIYSSQVSKGLFPQRVYKEDDFVFSPGNDS